jgi:hypothetical protein
MTTHAERAEQLLALATRLTSVLEEDAAILRSRRPAQLAGRQQDRDILMLQYTKAVGEFRKAHVKGSLPPALRQKLATATEKLMAATREHSSLLCSLPARDRGHAEGRGQCCRGAGDPCSLCQDRRNLERKHEPPGVGPDAQSGCLKTSLIIAGTRTGTNWMRAGQAAIPYASLFP